jgi:hypothetical protein
MRCLAVLLFLVTSIAPAAADSEADKLFLEGRRLLSSGDAKGACVKFHAANSRDPGAYSVLLNLGLCYEAQGRLATALKWYRIAQNKASEAQPQTDDTRGFEQAAKEKKVGLAEKVAKLTIDVSATQPDVVISVDGARVQRGDLASPVEVDAGSHTVEARAPGRSPHTETFEIADGESRSITIPALAESPPDEPVPTAPPPRNRRGLGIGLVATGTVLLGGTLGLNLYLRDATPKGEISKDTGKAIQRYAGTSMFVVGIAAVAAGGYFIVKKPARERQAAVVPVLAPDSLGIAVTGGF